MQDLFSRLTQILLRSLPLVLMAIVAGITFWLVQIHSPSTQTTGTVVKRHEADYYMDRLSATELADDGSTKYRFNGSRMVHFEDDQTYEVTKPAIRAYQPGRPEITAFADVGYMDAAGTVVDLAGNARVLRDQGADAAHDPLMTAKSQTFQVLLNDDVVRTDKPVELRHGQSIMNASGMVFNNVSREVQLLGNVRGSIAPRR
jgi:lipopolysaccharide export system protein LptC